MRLDHIPGRPARECHVFDCAGHGGSKLGPGAAPVRSWGVHWGGTGAGGGCGEAGDRRGTDLCARVGGCAVHLDQGLHAGEGRGHQPGLCRGAAFVRAGGAPLREEGRGRGAQEGQEGHQDCIAAGDANHVAVSDAFGGNGGVTHNSALHARHPPELPELPEPPDPPEPPEPPDPWSHQLPPASPAVAAAGPEATAGAHRG